MNVDNFLPFHSFDSLVVSRSKCIQVNKRPMWEYFVVYQRWKFRTSKSESDMAIRGSVEKGSFRRVDWFQKLDWIALILEVDKILVVFENFNICKFSPSSLNLLSCNFFFWFLWNFLLLLSIISIRPLDLDWSYMIHWKDVIFIQSSCKTHLKSCLNFSSTKVWEAVILLNV